MQDEVIGLTPSCNSTNFSNVDGQEEWQGLHGCKGLEICGNYKRNWVSDIYPGAHFQKQVGSTLTLRFNLTVKG